MNIYWLFIIIPASIFIGFVLCFCYILHTVKKATGVKSWKEFIEQTKKAQKLQKKMEKEGIGSIMNDPEIRKQMEEFRKKFGKSK